MKFNFNKLADRFPYPDAFKTGRVGEAAIMTGYNHEEYFQALELQEELALENRKIMRG